MFFLVTDNTHTHHGFSANHKFGSFNIYCDNGWKYAHIDNKNILFKGYVNDADLNDLVLGNDLSDRLGNYCVLIENNSTIEIRTSLYRSFPIYYNSTTITNFSPSDDSHEVYADSKITINKDLSITQNVVDIIGDCDLVYNQTDQTIINNIDRIIRSSIENFIKHNKLPLKVFLTGGLDSMLIYSYIKQITSDFEMLTYHHHDYDTFWYSKGQRIMNDNWSYLQIHHWNEPCVLMSGAPGDEYTMRNPEIANLFMRYHGVDVIEYLQNQTTQMYHTKHFTKQSYIDKLNKQQPMIDNIKKMNREDMVYFLCNMLVNDYQHYHLGNTLTFTPLRDINIVKQFMSLSNEGILSQVINGDITRELIGMNDSTLLQYISDDKNSDEYMSNIPKLFAVLGL
jgi:hypothetical protein